MPETVILSRVAGAVHHIDPYRLPVGKIASLIDFEVWYGMQKQLARLQTLTYFKSLKYVQDSCSFVHRSFPGTGFSPGDLARYFLGGVAPTARGTTRERGSAGTVS